MALCPARGRFVVAGMEVTPVPIRHGVMDILGYRIGDMVYMTDISSLPESSLPLVEGVGTMIISCVRHRFHRTHLNISGAKRLHRLVRPGRTVLTHLTHYFTHEELSEIMPDGIEPAYDGMRLEIAL